MNENQIGFCDLGRETTKEDVTSTFGYTCSQYFELVKKYAALNGLGEKGIDELMVFSIIKAESNCVSTASEGGGRGLMQLAGEEYKNVPNSTVFDPEYNIREGTKHLSNDYQNIKNKGIQPNDEIITLILFSYNRGIATSNLAIENFTGNKYNGLKDSMVHACYYYYDIGAYRASEGGSSCGGFDRDACCGVQNSVSSTSWQRLGANYPNHVLVGYKEGCIKIGGKIVT